MPVIASTNSRRTAAAILRTGRLLSAAFREQAAQMLEMPYAEDNDWAFMARLMEISQPKRLRFYDAAYALIKSETEVEPKP